jgi:phenylacetate-CoA ligase
MGAWIGGVFTYQALKLLAERGDYDISVITPGIHKMEVINAVKQLGHRFDQIIIGSYAPFLKDILEDGEREGVKWHDYNLGFVFSAEAFSENFRDFIVKAARLKNPLTSSLNHYGTVDMGTMAHETPLSIAVRRLAFKDDKLRKALFPEPLKQPTLAQYIPEMFYFEQINDNLICSAYSGIPLVRYDLKDYGGLHTKSQVEEALVANGYSSDKLLKAGKVAKKPWNLPFVYVYERNDFSVSYYAFLVYPDTIRRALHSPKLLKDLTGKFTAMVEYDDNGRQKLKVHLEMRHGRKSSESLVKKTQKMIHDSLYHDSSEYRELFRIIGEVAKPEIILWPYEDPLYFRPGTKQKWVIK